MAVLKLVSIGNSTGIVLPKELLHRMRVQKGDSLYVVETADGLHVTPYDPEVAAQLEQAEQVMREDRDVLKKLGE